MRKCADVQGHAEVKRVMIFDSPDGVFFFEYITSDDSNSRSDTWFENIEDAESYADSEFGVKITNWIEIDDPLEHCQHDWITPVRIKGRNLGTPEWGKLEMLKDGQWVDIES